MKTLRIILAAALFTLPATLFAGGNENEGCFSCSTMESVTLSSNDSAALADAGISIMLNNMTQQAHDRIREEGVSVILLDMTRKVRESVISGSQPTIF
jgi:hypothetical protein